MNCRILIQRKFLLVLTVLAALVPGGARELRAQEEAKTPEALLQAMAAAYSAAQSYSDKSEAHYKNADGSDRLSVTYRIWLARPSHFRLDAESRVPGRDKVRREVMWSEGAAARTWASDKPVSSQAKVQIAGSRMFGTYAYHVPTLFEPSYGARRRLHELKEASLVGEETFEGTECYHLKGNWEGDQYEVWLGKADSLVRKIVAKYSDHTLEEIHREIATDQPLAKEVFRFAPENEVPPPPQKKKK